MSCQHVNMVGRIDAPAKCELHSVILFLQTERWFMENERCSCFLLDLIMTSKSHSGVVLIHDNARPHSVVITQQLMEQFKLDVSYDPAYSPDLATSDFHLFLELKNWIGGQSFQKNEEIQSNVKAYLTSLEVTFFEERIVNLVHRHDKYLNLHGDYLENNNV
ncbi:hypothetical protein AVEN_58283-1 [Araneus ventricosus]|uniref:Histone-lysine N-methyltransferase SETMAR n=1 Tax=Araneus ventricosus TaxID=182803 RepID=A0A4Y2TD13_ARAVE|nr:hypothetical protein AVEN_58283-1 [Araneus ventricosus]